MNDELGLGIWFRPVTLEWWESLPEWQRERLAAAIVALAIDPRPPWAQRQRSRQGEVYQAWVGERRIVYRIYKDDSEEENEVAVLVLRV